MFTNVLESTRVCGRLAVKIISTSAIAFFLPACTGFLPSHIHDAAAEKTAADLQRNLAEYRQNQAGLYDNMAVNLELFQAEEDELIGRLTADFTTALATKAPDFSWNQLIATLDDVDTQSNTVRTKILAEMRSDFEARNVAGTASANANEAITALEAEIATKKKDAQRWQEAAQRYRAAMSNLPSTLEGLAEKAKDISQLLTEVEIFDPEILEGLKEREIDPDDILRAVRDTNESLRKQLSKDLREAPGLTVLILELGLELAGLDRRRAEVALVSLQARARVFGETLVYLDIADELSKLGRNKIITDDRNRSIVSEINLERDSGSSTPNKLKSISTILLAPRFAVSAHWLVEYKGAVLDLRLNRIVHSESISASQVNDQAWQAMIGSGVDALAAYHHGGLKREDLANFFRLAQSIALFIIAA